MKNKIISAVLAAVIGFGAVAVPELSTNLGAYSCADAATTVSAPKASKKSGSYIVSGSFSVKLSCSTSGADIYYSVNNANYRPYVKPIKISKTTVLRVYSKKNGTKSSVKTYTYTLSPKVTITPNAGTYSGSQTVKLSSPVSGVKFFYSLDDSNVLEYKSSGIKIDKSCTLTVATVKDGWNTRIIKKKYTIKSSGTSSSSNSSGNGSILEDYSAKWAYNTLNSSQKKAYKELFNAVSAGKTNVELSDTGISYDDIDEMFWAFHYDNPQFLGLGNGYSRGCSTMNGTIVSMKLTVDYARTSGEIDRSEFESTAAKVIAKANTLKTDYDKLKYFHDWIINNTRYNKNGPAYIRKADGPIVYGTALCEGYSRAYEYLCQSVGIPCVCVASSGHMWNMVKLNGRWYNVDTTFDDPVMSDGSDTLRYDYFLKSTSTIQRADSDHRLSTPFSVPSATKDY